MKSLLMVGVLLLVASCSFTSRPEPEEILPLAIKAIQEKDTAAVGKYFDLDYISWDEYNTDYYGFEDGSGEVTSIYKLESQRIVKPYNIFYIAGYRTSEDFKTALLDSPPNQWKAIPFYNPIVLNLDSYKFIKKVESPEECLCTYEVFSKRWNRSFTIDFELQKTEEGNWRILYIKDFINFLNEIHTAEIQYAKSKGVRVWAEWFK